MMGGMSDEGSAAEELGYTATFTQLCYECDPPRCINYLDDVRVPSACMHEPPAVGVDL